MGQPNQFAQLMEHQINLTRKNNEHIRGAGGHSFRFTGKTDALFNKTKSFP